MKCYGQNQGRRVFLRTVCRHGFERKHHKEESDYVEELKKPQYTSGGRRMDDTTPTQVGLDIAMARIILIKERETL